LANVPEWVDDTPRLGAISLTIPSVFNWLDLRSCDIRLLVEANELLAFTSGNTGSQHSHPRLVRVMGMVELLSLLGSMHNGSTTKGGVVSRTNLCGQLIVTSILRMPSEFRALGLAPFRPERDTGSHTPVTTVTVMKHSSLLGDR
jgi:hypothetical protein